VQFFAGGNGIGGPLYAFHVFAVGSVTCSLAASVTEVWGISGWLNRLRGIVVETSRRQVASQH
jgi:hypothetical protein